MEGDDNHSEHKFYKVLLGWPNCSFGFFRNILWKNLSELLGQPSIFKLECLHFIVSNASRVSYYFYCFMKGILKSAFLFACVFFLNESAWQGRILFITRMNSFCLVLLCWFVLRYQWFYPPVLFIVRANVHTVQKVNNIFIFISVVWFHRTPVKGSERPLGSTDHTVITDGIKGLMPFSVSRLMPLIYIASFIF